MFANQPTDLTLAPTQTLVLLVPVRLLTLGAAIGCVPTAVVDSLSLTVVALQSHKHALLADTIKL